MTQKRLLALVGAFAIMASASGGSSATQAPAGSPAAGESTAPSESAAASGNLAAEQILNTDIQGEPPTLDPTKAQDSNSIAVLYAVHRPLAYTDKDLNVIPSLAESWDISSDASEITFHLRDAKYSNGDPIVAGDLVYSWKRLVDPRTAAPYGYVMSDVAGGDELIAMAGADPMPADSEIDGLLDKFGVSAPDDKTFVVKLAHPAVYFPSVATLWVTVPIQKKWIESENATEAANYVSSGPFVLDKWEHNSEIVLKPNPNWYGDVKPTLTEIHMAMSPEPAQAMAAYEAGEIDTFLPVPTEDVERVKSDPDLSQGYSELPGLSITYYTFNNGNDATGKKKLARCEDPKACPTANKNFRIALTQAIDKQAFIDATFNGLGPVANSFVMPGLPGYDESINPYPFDLDAAKASMDKALAELGYASAADIPALKFGFNSGAGHEPRVAFLAQAWQDAFGLKTEQIGSEFGVFLTQRTAGEYDIARDGWGADYPHANNQLNGLFTCGGGNNDSQYCNPEFDKLIQQAAAEQDETKAGEIYSQAQKLLFDDAPVLPLRFAVTPQLVRPFVTVTSSPLDSQTPGERYWEDVKILEH